MAKDIDPDSMHCNCPVTTTLEILGGRWKPIILYCLQDGPVRFNALKRMIPGITQRMLTLSLRELESDGLILRHVREVVPPHVDYAMSPLGESLKPVLHAMSEWGAYYRTQTAPPQATSDAA
ncbi:winged helix-turn-helix transcriptional regulator [Rhodobium gokarnense]|uniref:DNA-binding HxlR family transcriptional regulator n=1 Tax=Rhodobium gokarnense TaxID=364296 RepID=A0ABT3HIC2_9HYPH|nr:helix-turn-helix domain-containing protein [Rhodobium gokarnense]MCW2310006.1 DNA-binding HxlR family transcriptional regulator [Rhodobium gokarnense]